MANGIFSWSKWSPHLGNAITIATGVPVVLSMIAGVWAHLSGSGLSIAMVVIAVFMMSLWCCIGVIWLSDRAKSLSNKYVRADYDCSWSLTVEYPQIQKDAHTPLAEYQFRVHLINTSTYPIKYVVQEATTTLVNRVPKSTANLYTPGVLARLGGATRVSFSPYEKGMIVESGFQEGTGRLIVLYGHPSVGYSRKMIKEFRIKTRFPPPPDSTQTERSGLLPTEIVFIVEDEEPYRDVAISTSP